MQGEREVPSASMRVLGPEKRLGREPFLLSLQAPVQLVPSRRDHPRLQESSKWPQHIRVR